MIFITRWLVVALLGLFTLAGCGGSGSNVVADPLAKGNSAKTDPTDSGKVLNYTMSLLPGKSTMLANDEQLLTATLTDASNRPVASQLVSFSIVAGPATAATTTMTTDSNGVALGFVRTGTATATTNVIVQASASIEGSSVVAYGSFQVSPSDASLTSSRLSLSVSSFTVKPNEQLFVSATARDSSGNPLANQVITWDITAGSAAMLTTKSATDSNGTAVALVKAGTATAISNVVVKASTTANGNDVTAVIPFQIVPPTTAVLAYTMTMAPSKPVIDNNEQFYITAVLKDSGGNPVITTPVTFRIATGKATVSPDTITVNTDSTGKAIATIQGGNPGFSSSVIVEASAMIKGTLVAALAPVQITPQVESPSVLQMTLTTDKTTVGTNADVIVSATITDMQRPPRPVQNNEVTFSVIAGPATVIDTSMKTDSTGTAVIRLKVGTVNSSSSIIIQASARVDGVANIAAYTTIQVVRQNSYIINFLTTKTTTDPSGNLNTLSGKIGAVYPWPQVGFKQLVPFQVLDNNGVPKPNLDVNIEVFNYGRNDSTVIELVPPWPELPVVFPPARTIVKVRTDDHGMGIFTCNVSIGTPPPGSTNTESVIYSATATIPPEKAGGTPIDLLSYGGFIVTVEREKPEVTTTTTPQPNTNQQ